MRPGINVLGFGVLHGRENLNIAIPDRLTLEGFMKVLRAQPDRAAFGACSKSRPAELLYNPVCLPQLNKVGTPSALNKR